MTSANSAPAAARAGAVRAGEAAGRRAALPSEPRRIRVVVFSPWAGRRQSAGEYLAQLPGCDLRPRVSDPANPRLMLLARLDCDWHGENARAFSAMQQEGLEFLPAWVVGVSGAADLLLGPKPRDEEWWFVIGGQHPQMLGATAGRLFAAYRRHGVRLLYYAFDEASRTMPCFNEIAPYLSVLIHDERPLAKGSRRRLAPDALVLHRSWVANLIPFSAPFVEEPEAKILFLGSQLGLTDHRQRQIDFLQHRFGDRFTAICDHSLPVGDRGQLGRFKVSLCPEGRKFGVPAMSASHTDRPFWSGCLGLVPVSEDSQAGGRLEELHRAGLIQRYPHGNLEALGQACECALAASAAERRRLYEHFNRHETIGAVVGEVIRRAAR